MTYRDVCKKYIKENIDEILKEVSNSELISLICKKARLCSNCLLYEKGFNCIDYWMLSREVKE